MNSLEKHALRLIQENVDSPDVFTDDATGMAQIRDSINDAIQELAALTGAYKRTYHLPLYADRLFYRMGWEADHFGWIMEAWDRNRQQSLVQTDLNQIRLIDQRWLQTTGTPEMYMQIGEDIVGIYRKPSANGTVLELDCVCIPKRYTADTDPIKLKKEFQRATVYNAVSEFYASRGDANRANEYLSKYIETGGIATLHPDYAEKTYQYNNRFNNQSRNNHGKVQ